MSITLPLTPQAAAELERCAAAAGVDLATFVLHAVQEKLEERDANSAEPLTYDQWRSQFRHWVASHRSRNPQLDDRREAMYD
jgi:hypothetical protein